jgi:hypothetical protein
MLLCAVAMRANPSGYGAWLEFYRKHHLLSSSEAHRVGLSREWLSWAARQGQIVKIVPGLYRKADQPWDRTTRLELIGRILPRTTISLTTALNLNGILDADESEGLWLSFGAQTYVPDLSGLGARAVRSSTPPEPGDVHHVRVGHSRLSVHSTARAVVECFRFRDRVGTRAAIHAMEAALGAFACHPGDLKKIARRCRVERVVRSHLATWSRRGAQPDLDVRRPGRPPHRRDPVPLVAELAWANGTLPKAIADRAILPPRPRPLRPPDVERDDDPSDAENSLSPPSPPRPRFVRS